MGEFSRLYDKDLQPRKRHLFERFCYHHRTNGNNFRNRFRYCKQVILQNTSSFLTLGSNLYKKLCESLHTRFFLFYLDNKELNRTISSTFSLKNNNFTMKIIFWRIFCQKIELRVKERPETVFLRTVANTAVFLLHFQNLTQSAIIIIGYGRFISKLRRYNFVNSVISRSVIGRKLFRELKKIDVMFI